MLRRASLLVVMLVGCNSTTALPDVSYTVFAADGSNPLTGRSLTNARAYFAQDVAGAIEDSTDSAITNGTFDLVVPIDSFSVPIHVRLELSDANGVALVGGTPSYYPGESQRVAVLVGVPGHCDSVVGLQIGTARHSFGASLVGRYALLSGGMAASALPDVDAIDLLGYGQYALTSATVPLGVTRSATIDRTRALVVSEGTAPYAHRLYQTDASTARPSLALHTGASTADAVLAVPDVGAVAIGGGDALSPASQLSWVLPPTGSSTDEIVTIQSLNAAEPDRAAAVAANGVWVVSGGNGPTTLEQIVDPFTATSVHLASIADGVRHGAMLFADTDGTAFLLVGGVDASATIRTDTLAITGCPTACVASPGPTWTNARLGVASEPSGMLVGGEIGGVASGLVERVAYSGGQWTITSVATLTNARTDAAIVRFPTGPVLVFGGRDTSPRNDVEVCFFVP